MASLTGTIKKKTDKGFGFIAAEDGTEYFYHQTGCVGARIDDLRDGVVAASDLEGFPERAWGGRVWVPCSTRGEGPAGELELFGHVSYVQPESGDPGDLRAKADFTDILAEDNPDWRIDLNDDVIGRWRGENGRAGDVTLVWGRPIVQGAVAASAELDRETVDQEAISNGRFTLIALDALEGYGDDIFMQVKLWSRRAKELASESLYDEPAGPDSSAG